MNEVPVRPLLNREKIEPSRNESLRKFAGTGEPVITDGWSELSVKLVQLGAAHEMSDSDDPTRHHRPGKAIQQSAKIRDVREYVEANDRIEQSRSKGQLGSVRTHMQSLTAGFPPILTEHVFRKIKLNDLPSLARSVREDYSRAAAEIEDSFTRFGDRSPGELRNLGGSIGRSREMIPL